MLRLPVLLAALVIFSAEVVAEETSAESVAENIVLLTDISNRCPDLSMSSYGQLSLAMAMTVYGIEPGDIREGGKLHGEMLDTVATIEVAIASHGLEVYCAVGKAMYGADGLTIENMLEEN